jgi:hypothetical protein
MIRVLIFKYAVKSMLSCASLLAIEGVLYFVCMEAAD